MKPYIIILSCLLVCGGRLNSQNADDAHPSPVLFYRAGVGLGIAGTTAKEPILSSLNLLDGLTASGSPMTFYYMIKKDWGCAVNLTFWNGHNVTGSYINQMNASYSSYREEYYDKHEIDSSTKLIGASSFNLSAVKKWEKRKWWYLIGLGPSFVDYQRYSAESYYKKKGAHELLTVAIVPVSDQNLFRFSAQAETVIGRYLIKRQYGVCLSAQLWMIDIKRRYQIIETWQDLGVSHTRNITQPIWSANLQLGIFYYFD